MRILRSLARQIAAVPQAIESRLYRRGIDALERADPEQMLADSGRRAVRQFRRLAERVPFYRDLLARHGVDARSVTRIDEFKQRVPVLSKDDVFRRVSASDLCVDGCLDDIQNIMPSSGASSGVLSFGISSRGESARVRKSVDALFDYWFDTRRKKTFLINSLAMGVKVPTALPCADVSVRSDMVIALLQRLAGHFDLFILIGDTYFIQEIVAHGLRAGLSWSTLPLRVVMGGDWFPESYRAFLTRRMGLDRELVAACHPITSAMGLAELGHNLCQETPCTVRIRRLAEQDDALRQALFGDMDVTPMIGHYDPLRAFVETVPAEGGGETLVFTMLSSRGAMPLVRYDSGDLGRLFTWQAMADTLQRFGHGQYVPKMRLPLVAVAGKNNRFVAVGAQRIRPEWVRALLYGQPGLACLCTGQFTLGADAQAVTDAAASPSPPPLRLRLQLHRGVAVASAAAVADTFVGQLRARVPADVALVPFFDFHPGMGVDYERKFKHLDDAC